MNLTNYTSAARNVTELRNLRRIRLFTQRQAVTVVTYFKDKSRERCDYAGKAFTINWFTMSISTVNVAHSAHAPPQEDEEDQEAEIEPYPSLAIGCQWQHTLTTM